MSKWNLNTSVSSPGSFRGSIRLQIRLLSFLCVLLGSSVSFGQLPVVNDIISKVNDYNSSGIKEKIYVHTDKNYYLTGEIVWMKLYYTDAVSNKPIDVSKVAYVEILDSANNAVAGLKAGLNKGQGNGSLYLAPGIASGYYKLRAYTNWMKNFDADYYFEKTITIINLNKTSPPATESAGNIDLQFFPEGGDLVNGITGKVGFKAVDAHGKGINFSGYLLDGTDTLSRFSSAHAGMGNFQLTPQPRHNYSAIIKTADGLSTKKELPQAKQQGVVMSLSKNPNGTISIIANTNDASLRDLYLIAHTRSAVKLSKSAVIQAGKALFEFSESDLGEGISQITIFNDKKEPLCERLYFRRPQAQLGLALNTNQPFYETRKEVTIDLSSQLLGKSDTAGLSMTVFRIDSLTNIDSNSILHYLYLSSDLKGTVEDPSYYFSSSRDAEIAADNLMLTQGWRRFKWNEVLAGKLPRFSFPPEIRGHFITGSVLNSLTNETAANIYTYIGSPSDITQFGSAISDHKGNVTFEMTNFSGGKNIIAQTNSLTPDSIYRIKINSPFSREYGRSHLPAFTRPVQYPNTLRQQYKSMQVRNIYATDRMSNFSYPDFTDTASFYVNADNRYELDRYTRFTSMEEVLREYVILVNVRRRAGRVELPVVDPASSSYLPGQPLNLLDGVPVFDFTKFFEFDPLKIKQLEVIPRRYIYGQRIFDGILNWKTYSPSLANYTLPANAVVVDYEGLQAEREFYAPVYDTPERKASNLPDYRIVLQWDPYIKLAGGETSSIKFYTSDVPGKYAVSVEGLSQQGLAGNATTTFEVK